MRRIFLVLIFSIAYNVLFGQNNFENYYPIISNGSAPNDFIINKVNRYNKQLGSLSKKEISKLKKDRFLYAFLNSNSHNVIFSSGFVTFKDPISIYANKILDLLLKDNKELRSKLRIYLIKSTSVNAFTTNEGVIFISVGLMAQIQSEAQLANVLSHEIVHFQNKHHLEDYIHLLDVIQGIDKSVSYDKTVESLFSYSKQQEFEADLEGYEKFYKNSGYLKTEIESLFDVLLYSYLPFDEIKFDIGFFESENFKFPDEYKLSKYNEITAVENYDDSKSTHPNIIKRRVQILEKMAGEPKTGVLFQVSEKEFNNVREIARFELSYLFQLNNSFEKAIYNSYLLLKKYPNNKFLRTSIAESLYGLAFYNNRNDFERAHVKPDAIEGYSQQVFHLFDKLNSDELNLLALRYSWNLSRSYKDDINLAQLADSIISETVWAMNSNLLDYPLEKTAKLEKQDTVVNFAEMSKTDKIKYKKKTGKLEGEGVIYYYNSFIDLIDKNELIKKYEKIKNNSNDYYLKLSEEKRNRNRNQYRYSLKNVKFGDSLGIDKIVLLMPEIHTPLGNYSSLYFKEYFTTEQKIYRNIKNIANRLKLEIVEFGLNKSDSGNINAFNDYALLSSWLYELNFQNNIDYLPSTQKYISSLAKKYGTNYFAWIGVNYSKFGSYELLIIDVSNNKLVTYYNQALPQIGQDFLKLNIYNSLYRVKSKS